MKKDKNWLKEQLSYLQDGVGESFNDYSEGLNAAYNTLEILIDQLEEPEQEKPVIPQFVGDWIEEMKNEFGSSLRDVYEDYFKRGYSDDVDEYLDNNNSFETFTRAWIDGYSVEKERVLVPQFVADFIEEIKPNFNIRAVFTLQNNKHEQGQEWALDNPDVFARAWIDGYSVEKEPQWAIERYGNYIGSYIIEPGCIDVDYEAEKVDAFKFIDKSKAEAVALLINGTVEEITK